MTAGPRSLLDLRRVNRREPTWLVSLVQPQLNGGRLDPRDLAQLDERPEATALRVSGLDQRTFELVVAEHGSRFSALDLWKCPRIADLSPLEDMTHLRLVSAFWNQRSAHLWDLSRTPALEGLHLTDFIKLRALDDVARGVSLNELEIEGGNSSPVTVDTYEPVGALTGLRSLSLGATRPRDGRVEPLGALVGLERLTLPSNIFTWRQLAWLSARLPSTVEAASLRPYRRLGHALGGHDTLLMGKRQPFVSWDADQRLIQAHTARFEAAVAEFRADPLLGPG
ncbi:hypothetical protein QQX13_08160 [Demequina sp. SYSU T00068]|uniref:hypothetical protein n=1 Tax=Demequina lignilytica TaxID=3051663 RepID=UPI00261F2117|nr:hypothetical protein [Demequina sp. SYSU T00068]MDN4490804.1 hypothetical protein [Demequina sp. SYSU T00068]